MLDYSTYLKIDLHGPRDNGPRDNDDEDGFDYVLTQKR
jgi:hypothetical protein